MGTVWAARDERLDRDVAIKVLPRLLVSDSAAQRRFEREARAMGRLQHPNVVSIYDIGSADPGTGEELPFLVMEIVHGQSLDKLLTEGPLPCERAVHIFGQVADALASAHEAGVIHRDLKPSNIMVGARDHVSVLDFGLARLVQQEGSSQEDTLTTPGMVLGSCPYMAPEQALGQKVGPGSDVFSYGAVLYEALVGRRPFDGETPMRVLQAVVRCDFTPLAQVAPTTPEPLAKFVTRCLAREPEKRFASGVELAREAAGIRVGNGGSGAVPAVASGRTGAVRLQVSWWPRLLLVGALAAAVGFVLGMLVG